MKSHLRPQGGDISPLQAEFIDWLVDPERAGSQNQWAKDHGISTSTVSNWKKRDTIFRDALEQRAAEVNADPERIQKLVNKLYEVALTGDVKAMTLYLQYVDKFTPKVDLGAARERDLAELSDEELAALAEQAAFLRRSKQAS